MTDIDTHIANARRLTALAALHRKLALAWWEARGATPAGLNDPGTWSFVEDAWKARYVAIRASAGIGYDDQAAALRWAFNDTRTWGEGQSWARLLSGRSGGTQLERHIAKITDQMELDTRAPKEPDRREYHEASPEFQPAAPVESPELTEAVRKTGQEADGYVAMLNQWVRDDRQRTREPEYVELMSAAIAANCTAISRQARYGRKSRAGNLAGNGWLEQISAKAARAVVHLAYKKAGI